MSEDTKKSAPQLIRAANEISHKKGPNLVQYSGKKLGKRIYWPGDSITIGSDDHAEFKIEELSMAPIHAKLTREPEGYFVTDLGSDKGTFINNSRVIGRQQFYDGDILLLGDVWIKFFAE